MQLNDHKTKQNSKSIKNKSTANDVVSVLETVTYLSSLSERLDITWR